MPRIPNPAQRAGAGSKYHRPAEHTHSVRSKTLQSLQMGMAAARDEEPADDGIKRDAAGEPLCEDQHDEFCYICGLGVGPFASSLSFQNSFQKYFGKCGVPQVAPQWLLCLGRSGRHAWCTSQALQGRSVPLL
jgi:hypothetical protein